MKLNSSMTGVRPRGPYTLLTALLSPMGLLKDMYPKRCRSDWVPGDSNCYFFSSS
jgi:hypothetical protein